MQEVLWMCRQKEKAVHFREPPTPPVKVEYICFVNGSWINLARIALRSLLEVTMVYHLDNRKESDIIDLPMEDIDMMVL